MSAVSVVKERRACLRLCTFGRGVQADARGLVQASNSIGSVSSVLLVNGKLIVLPEVASIMKDGKVRRTLSPTAMREQP